MVDLGETDYWKEQASREKFIIYNFLKARLQNEPKSREVLELELEDHPLPDVDDFCKDKNPEETAALIDEIQLTVSKNFNSSIRTVRTINKRILKFHEENQPSTSMMAAQNAAFDLLQANIRQLYANASLYKYGSSANGLASNSSDIDLTLIFDEPTGLSESGCLHDIQVFLNENMKKELVSVKTISGAHPILVLELRINDTIVDVDISIQNHKTVLNSYIIRQYTKIDRRFPVLACIIRKWAKTNQLFGGNCGRFNSYALNLMVIHYLQCGVSPPILPYLGETHPNLFEFDATVKTINVKQDLDVHFERTNKMTVLQLLAGFMLYWKDFEFEKYRPSILGATLQNRFNRKNFYFSNPVCILDPCFGNNPARTVTFLTLMNFRDAAELFIKICRRNNKRLVDDFETIFGLSESADENFEEKSLNLFVPPKFDWLLIW